MVKNMSRIGKCLKSKYAAMLAVGAASSLAAPAFATPAWYESFSIETTPMTAIAGLIMAAIGVLWIIRKAIKTGNKS